ncbi:MAG: hypothetical protein HY879_13085 [Deltaproteobacteria bacterium]|nr:hypothetical protein [Deltaproteobacteria bacterium]
MNKSEFESLEAKGPETVLSETARGLHGDPGSRTRDGVEAWVRSKQVTTDAAHVSARDAREKETLAIAKEANRLASEANSIARIEAADAARSARWAKYAAIIAAISAIATIIISVLAKK